MKRKTFEYEIEDVGCRRIEMARAHHQWRQKSKWQQICAICGQVRRWNGEAWRYRKEGALVLERQPCHGDRSVEDRYAELRALVEAWQKEPSGYTLTPLLDWRHR